LCGIHGRGTESDFRLERGRPFRQVTIV